MSYPLLPNKNEDMYLADVQSTTPPQTSTMNTIKLLHTMLSSKFSRTFFECGFSACYNAFIANCKQEVFNGNAAQMKFIIKILLY